MKLLKSFLLFVLFSISITGCGQKQAEPGTDTHNRIKEMRLVKKPNKAKYLITNGVEITHQQQSMNIENHRLSVTLPQISGLVDKELEKRINKAIVEDTSIELKKVIKDIDKAKQPEYVYCEVQFNSNNLLAISISTQGPTLSGGLLYRLTDGKRLYLKDMFTEGTDYLSFMNQRVIEGILRGSEEEEDILKEPFSSIKPDQPFAIIRSSLYLIFYKGDGGFSKQSSVEIPLSAIDDYMDVMDRYSGEASKNYLNNNIMTKSNNIFSRFRSDLVKRKNGDILVTYAEITGLRDAKFEKTINSTIRKAVDEVLQHKLIREISTARGMENHPAASMAVHVSFNHYGILSLTRYVSIYDEGKQSEDFQAVYAFDLSKKREVNLKKVLESQLSKDKTAQQVFVDHVRNNIIGTYSNNNSDLQNSIKSTVDYRFIMDKGIFNFRQGSFKDDIAVAVMIKGDSIKGIPHMVYFEVPLGSITKADPEEFFAVLD
jgi:hypothetical protein